MKLIKIRFTSWRDQSVAPRKLEFQDRLEAWNARETALTAAAAAVKAEQAHADSEALQRSLVRIDTEVRKIDSERTFLLSVEEAAAEAETRAATEHEKVGTFGYQVVEEPGNRVAMVVDEAGDYLPAQALYTCEVVDTDPLLPAWAKKGKFGHFE